MDFFLSTEYTEDVEDAGLKAKGRKVINCSI